jgi:hypothetical protein
MAEQPGAIWKDLPDPGRTSAGGPSSRTLRFGLWLEQMKPRMTHRAWRGGRGWAYAKMLSRDGEKWQALKLYLAAVLTGCYAPRLAVVIALQIFLGADTYRRLADAAIGGPQRGRSAPAVRRTEAPILQYQRRS